MTLPARPGRQIGQAIGLGAIVAVLTACTAAFLLYALRHPVALPHDATADAMIRHAATYLVLATVLFMCLLAAAFDLFRFVDDLQVAEQPAALTLDLRPTALDREIAGAVDSVREVFREAGFVIDVTTDATVVTCDGARIRQAVLALLDDMRRHSAPARLKFFVEDRAAGAVVRIEDTGSRRFVETGLGLSVLRAVVDAHGGQIRHLASPGGDAVLEFDIPRHAPAIRAFPR